VCARRTQSAGWCVRGYEAGGAAGVLAGAAAGAAVVPSDDAGVEELVDVDEVDAGVVLLEVDLLSVL